MLKKRYEFIDGIIENGIYLYIILMFLSKGEGVRNIILYGNLGLWLLTLKQRAVSGYFRKPFFIVFCLFLTSTVVSTIYSIDPFYSFTQLTNEPLKALLVFPVFSTVLADEKRLWRVSYAFAAAMGIILLNGYYSYFSGNADVLKSDTWLLHGWYNRFSSYLLTLIPFSFALFFKVKSVLKRLLLAGLISLAVIAVFLNGTRTGYLGLVVVGTVWAFYIAKINRYRLTRVFPVLVLAYCLTVSIAFAFSPWVRTKIMRTTYDVFTLNDRISGWYATIDSFSERPVAGWGYGKKIFHRDEPFQNTVLKIHPDVDDPHNTFLMVMFHQGITGLLLYMYIIGTAFSVFCREGFSGAYFRNYFLTACFSVIFGTYIAYAFFNPVKFHHLAIFLSVGMAAKAIGENSTA